MKKKKPQINNFSNKYTHNLFSINLLNKLVSLKEKREEFLDFLDDNLDFYYSKYGHTLKEDEIKKITNNIKSKIDFDKSVLLMTKQRKISFFKEYKVKDKCLICNEKIGMNCHLLKDAFFRNKKRLPIHYKIFKDHISNLIFLCPNHHRRFDHENPKRLSKREINKILREQKKLNNKFIKNIDNEIKKMNNVLLLMDKIDKYIFKELRKEIKKLMRKL